MVVRYNGIYNEMKSLLQKSYGNNAEFREGQYEAIEAALTNKRTLVVQKTGWGKSLVYFSCAKYLRNHNAGITFVVSPLLVLMDNQLEAAQKIGLKASMLNHRTEDNSAVIESIINGEIDIVFITPESLFGDIIQQNLSKIDIALFVIDEAHCISDWGHDFRLEYGRLYKIINILPPNVSVLATTATANNRVIKDLTAQLGDNVFVSRGELARSSLAIQTINLPSKAQRYAWILNHINELPGNGIIYCITTRDCDRLAEFLQINGVNALSYHSRLDEEQNIESEKLLKENKIKALVATVKLGMGYDKDDISFVIHFQMPANVVAYYQQIGRAGRKLNKAYAILLHGKEDEEINDYFINSAFPHKSEVDEICECLSSGGKSINQLSVAVNLRRNRIEKVLMFLEKDGCLFKDGSKYFLSAKQYKYDYEKFNKLKKIRNDEYDKIKGLTKTNECLMKYVVNCLDDYSLEKCNHCASCVGQPLISEEISQAAFEKALKYLNSLTFPIIPKLRWSSTEFTKQTKINHPNQEGICLSKYGDPGFGEMVKNGKYRDNHFSDELIVKSAEILNPIVQKYGVSHITCVPSLRSNIVKDFSIKLAKELNISFLECLKKSEAPPQKDMENSSHQCANAYSSFKVKELVDIPNKIILIDDVVDSGWTIAVCGNYLGEAGCEFVFPFALADSSNY